MAAEKAHIVHQRILARHPQRADRASLELSAVVLSGGMAEVLVEHADGNLELPTERLVAHLLGLYSQAALLATTTQRADA